MVETVDLSHLRPLLEAIFAQYPPGNHCDLCATALGKILKDDGYQVNIVTLQNEEVPGRPGIRGRFIMARHSDGSSFALGVTGFHMTCRIEQEEKRFYIDSLVNEHFGTQAVDTASYFALFVYPDSMEITLVQQVR